MSERLKARGWRVGTWRAVGGALVLGAGAIAAPGCGHTKKADETSRAEERREERRQAQREGREQEKGGSRSAARAEAEGGARAGAGKGDDRAVDQRGAGGEAPKPEPGEAARTAQDIPIVSSPAGLYADGGVAQIRRALAGKGLLDAKGERDTFDAETRAAVRKFQDQQNMPATGVPDHETVSRLGLDPDEIFKKARTREPERR